MKLIPREDQEQKIVRVLAEPTKSALIADDMGKGKTLMGTEILLRADLPRTLIVGIRDTGKQWAATIAGQSDSKTVLRIMNSTVPGTANYEAFMNGEPGVFFAGIQWLTSRDWEVVEKQDHSGNPIPVIDKKTGLPTGKNVTISVPLHLFGQKLNTKKRHIDMLIFDEVHKMQNRKSQTARTIISIKSDWRLGLSGTFAGNSFSGAWKVTSWLWPDIVDKSFVQWSFDWCEMQPVTRQDGTIILDARGNPMQKVLGEKKEGAYVASLPCYIRDEPDVVPAPRILQVELTPRQRAQYSAMENTSLAWLEAHTPFGKEPLIADLPITQRQRLRTMALGEVRFGHDDEITFDVDTPSAKLNVLKYVIDNIWMDMPILIGVYSARFVKVAAARFQAAGYGAVAWHGGLSAKEREGIKERFIASDPSVRYLFATIPSIGTGTDGLQKACSRIVTLERSDSRLDNLQFLKRIFRDGMTGRYGDFDHLEIIANQTLDDGIFNRQGAENRSMSASMRT
jgi:hypothetical protein